MHCISPFGLAHFMQFTNGIPIDRLLFHWYQSTSSFRGLSSVNISTLQLEQRSAAFFSIGAIGIIGSNGTNRQVVSVGSQVLIYAGYNWSSDRLPPFPLVPLVPLVPMVPIIGSNGTNRQIVYARPSGVNICSLQIVYQSSNYFSNGIDLNQWHQSTNCLRTALAIVRIVRLL